MAAILEQAEVATELRPAIAGRNPWLLAGRRLWHNRIAMAALVLFLPIVVSLLAPVYANDIANTNPFVNNLNGTTIVTGAPPDAAGEVPEAGRTPIGPTRDVHHYFPRDARPRRGRAAALRRAQRAAHRHGWRVSCSIIATYSRRSRFFGGDGLPLGLMDVPAFPVLLLLAITWHRAVARPHPGRSARCKSWPPASGCPP
jgi:peptide/nickel transport system permease protein